MNRILIKIGFVAFFFVLVYISFIMFIISPKITEYLVESETQSAKAQLNRIASLVQSREEVLKKHKELKIAENKENIKNINNIAYNIMEDNYRLFLSGKISKQEAIKNSFSLISKIKYGYEDDYIYVLDKEGNLVFHPSKKYMGTNSYNYFDEKGKAVIRDLIKNTLENGSFYSNYFWHKLNDTFLSEKIVHSVYFEPFGFIISSGVYIQSIEKEIEKEKEDFLKTLYPMIMSIRNSAQGYMFIIDKNNKMIFHPNKKLINQDVSKVKQPNSDKYMVDELKRAYKENTTWKYKWDTPEDRGNYIYNKLSWVTYNESFGWYITSSVYEDDLTIKAQEVSKIILKVSAFLLLILLIIAMFLVKSFLEPIFIMTKNAKLVKTGKFDIRNKIKLNDELGFLSNQFDEMLDSIEENTRNLEYKVEARTAELKYKLYYDELTGLKNRISLDKDLKKLEFCALNLLEIEGFDDINELYGYSVANEIIIEIMKMLKSFCEEKSLSLYRLDTGNFAIIDDGIEKFVSYDNFLEEMLAIFKKEIHIKSLDIEIFIYVTIGTSISQNEPLKSANIALKNAKQNGVRFLVYNKSIDTRDNIKKSMYWREKINEAIDEDRVIPFFQAIFDREKNIIKYETLMRICDEVDGKPYYLSPGTFFEVAVKTKQYFKLNQIVIKKALRDIDKIGKDISINISFSDVMNRGFSQFIEDEIDSLSKEQRKKVVFEILESDHISDYGILDAFILKYRKKGIRIAIDDFGTGYSNFSHILKVKPDYIKIDGSLIKNITHDDNLYEMVKAIVEFSKALNITIIAEFIHTQEVFEKVKELGVDEFQGYFLGEPELLI